VKLKHRPCFGLPTERIAFEYESVSFSVNNFQNFSEGTGRCKDPSLNMPPVAAYNTMLMYIED